MTAHEVEASRSGPDAADIAGIVDLERYPIAEPGAPAGREMVARCRAQIAEDGYCLLPGFVRPEAAAAMAAEADRQAPEAYFCASTHNAYLLPDDPAFPAEHPRRRRLRTDVGSLAYDRLAPGGPLCRLYRWDPLVDFVGAVLGHARFYRLADPLGALSVNVFVAGGGHSWHFDESEFTTTLMLQTAERGGDFECVPRIRPRDGEDHEAVAAVLDGRSTAVRRLAFEPGTLSIFGGRHAIHQVTRVEGGRRRLVAVLCFSATPGTVNSDLVRALFWGRTA